MGPTAGDVARRAGVSISTVSRALTSPRMVAEGTRIRVRIAAEELGYRPNRAARQLATGRTGTIGMVVPDLANPYFSSLVKAVQARARIGGYHVVVADTDEEPEQEPENVLALSGQVDGILLCSPRSEDGVIQRLAAGSELIVVDRQIPGLSFVIEDHAQSTRDVLRHLKALGHRQIACAGGPPLSWNSRQRIAGLHRAAAELGIAAIHDLGSFPPVFSGGRAAADLVLDTPATAIVIHNDLMALGLLQRMNERGIAVPGEFSVTSHDDIALAGAFPPGLTTVSGALSTLARAALACLRHRLHAGDEASTTTHTIATDLHVRGSTGPVTVPVMSPADAGRKEHHADLPSKGNADHYRRSRNDPGRVQPA